MHFGYSSNSQRIIYFALLIQFELIFPTNSLSPATNVEIEQCRKRSNNNDFEVIEVIAGENANVHCEWNDGKRGNGPSQLLWFSAKGDETPTFISQTENSRRYSKSNDGSNLVHLVILNFTELDQGCYQCQILFLNSIGQKNTHKLTKFIKVKQKPIQPATTELTKMPSSHQSAATFPSIPNQWTNPPETTMSPSTTNNSIEYYQKEYFPQMPLLFVCIALLTLVDILLACLVIKWCNDRQRRNDQTDIESLQNDSLSISTALDGTMLPSSPSDYKPFMQPSHTNNGAPAHPAYIVKVPIHSQRINAVKHRRRRYSQDLETIYENLELEME